MNVIPINSALKNDDSNPQSLAMIVFSREIQKLKSEEEISKFCQMLCTLSVGAINGIHGQMFKKDFLLAAIKDNMKITPKRKEIST